MIRGITFNEQAFYSADFAHYQNFFMAGKNGITKGCSITQDGSQVTISVGYFMVQGRMMNVETETIVQSSYGFEEGYNRLVYTIDLMKTNTVSDFNQGYLEVLHDETLVQDDLDDGGEKYQYPICHFQWNGSAISSFNIEAASINLENIFAEIEANWEVIKTEQEQWFAENKEDVALWFANEKSSFKEFFDVQEEEILQMVDNLENQSFVSQAEFNALCIEPGATANTITDTTITINQDYWGENDTYCDWISRDKVLASDCTPIIDLVCTLDNYEAEEEAWSKVFKAEVDSNGKLLLYASEAPTIDLTIQVKVVE